MENCKAPRPSGITSDILKRVSRTRMKELMGIYQKIMEGRSSPE
jgi:hypothetical protein